jgi:hypothetical protein
MIIYRKEVLVVLFFAGLADTKPESSTTIINTARIRMYSCNIDCATCVSDPDNGKSSNIPMATFREQAPTAASSTADDHRSPVSLSFDTIREVSIVIVASSIYTDCRTSTGTKSI